MARIGIRSPARRGDKCHRLVHQPERRVATRALLHRIDVRRVTPKLPRCGLTGEWRMRAVAIVRFGATAREEKLATVAAALSAAVFPVRQ